MKKKCFKERSKSVLLESFGTEYISEGLNSKRHWSRLSWMNNWTLQFSNCQKLVWLIKRINSFETQELEEKNFLKVFQQRLTSTKRKENCQHFFPQAKFYNFCPFFKPHMLIQKWPQIYSWVFFVLTQGYKFAL